MTTPKALTISGSDGDGRRWHPAWKMLAILAVTLLFAGLARAEQEPNMTPTDTASAAPQEARRPSLIMSVTIFILAILLGVELIGRVPATLHTPLMSGSNAVSGITVVGAVIAAGAAGRAGPLVATVAVVLAMINVVGGFLVTHRMLQMFKRK